MHTIHRKASFIVFLGFKIDVTVQENLLDTKKMSKGESGYYS